MKRILFIAAVCLAVCSVGLTLRQAAQQATQRINVTPVEPLRFVPAGENDTTTKTVAAAKAFLETLDSTKQAKVNYPFDSALKTKWSNFPIGIVPRNGIRWGDLTAVQRRAEMDLLAIALSKRGLEKVKAIIEGDQVLKTNDTGMGGGPMGQPPGGGNAPAGGPPPGARPNGGPGGGMDPGFGSDNYYIAFFGTPSTTEPWMIALGGHHLAINVTIVGKSEVITPSLPAAQPAIYKLNGETIRPLGRENDKAFELINSLDEGQKKQAILPFLVSDLILGPGQDGKTVQPEGIKVSALNASQTEKLLEVVNEWVGILNDEAGGAKMAEIKANLANTWFAWSGPTTNGSGSYFRIQGPTVWIEYSPQRNRQGGTLDPTHIHTVYRDPSNDYGSRMAKK